MQFFMSRGFKSVFIGLVLSISVNAAPLIEGRVRLDSGEPVADAQVRIFDMSDLRQGSIARATTDGTGYFALPLAALTGRALPQRFALGQNYPNPFNPSTIIPYQLAVSSAVRLEVFNLLGQRIATLVDGERPAGFHTATWRAVDGAGRAVGAGVYIYRMTVAAEHQTGRMVLLDGQAGVSASGTASVMTDVSGVGEPAEGVYGLIVSGEGLAPYVDSSFRVEAGMAPVELVVSAGQHLAGKATDDDCALCGLFDAFDDPQEEEADETPEEAAAPGSTSSAGGPDLIVQSPSASAVVLTPGQEFTLQVTVQNQGDQSAEATMLHYYRSNNSTISASDAEVGTGAVDALDASATSEQSIELTASVGVERYYGACVASVSGESNTDNNCSSAVKITVSGQEEPEEKEDETTQEEEEETQEEVPDDAPVTIPDANLRAAIAEKLGKASGATITVAEMKTFYYLHGREADIRDLTGLEFATNLRELDLDGNEITDVSPLSGFSGLTNLTHLVLSDNEITDVSPLSGLTNLTHLVLSDNEITDVSPLSGLTNLTYLELYGNTISDVSPLSGLTNLTWLVLNNNNITDVSPLSGLTKLVRLVLNNNNITDVSPLWGLTKLERLWLLRNPLNLVSIDVYIPALQGRGVRVSFDPIGGEDQMIPDANLRAVIAKALGRARGVKITKDEMKTLTSLEQQDLTSNAAQTAGIRDLTGLEFAINLTKLKFKTYHITDLSPLSGLTKLTTLYLSSNTISDVSPLSGLTNLRFLRLDNNNITDVSPLSGLTKLTWLNLTNNAISDLSPLSGLTKLTRLWLQNNAISDVSPLLGLTNLRVLDLLRNPLNVSSINDYIPLLESRGVTVSSDDLTGLVTDDPTPVTIPDAKLREKIEARLGKASGEKITRYEMMAFREDLFLHNAGIRDLTGLEFATNLTSLYLYGNEISDVSPLSGLTNLTSLDLSYNYYISDVSPLSGLTNLTWLNLRGNFLNVSSVNDHIPLFESRGVTVSFDPFFRESPFDIELVFLADYTAREKRLIEYAARRWMSIIREDLPDYTFTEGFSSRCGKHSYRIPAGERIDDLRIYITQDDDPDADFAGWAGTRVLRENSYLPVVGCMSFNLAFFSEYSIVIALHEIAHVLGFGTIWDDLGFLQNPSGNNLNADPHFNGPLAIAAFNDAGGRNYAGAKVPVAKWGGEGSVDSHWNYVLGRDIMSYNEPLQTEKDKLSAITIQSLADLGYSVDVTQADPYTLLRLTAAAKASANIAAPSTHAEPEWSCGTGQHQEPIYVIDPQGRIVRTISP